MNSIETFASLENEIKIDTLMKDGELIYGNQEEENMVYLFLVKDFFVCVWTNEETAESVLRVFRSSNHLDRFLDTYSIEEMY